MRRNQPLYLLAWCLASSFVLALTLSILPSSQLEAQSPDDPALALQDEEAQEAEETEPEQPEAEAEEAEEAELLVREMHHLNMEMEMAESQAAFNRLEMVGRVAEIAKDEVTSAAFAIIHIQEFFEENPEGAIGFLEDTLKQTDNAPVKRLIHIKLAELYSATEKPDKAQEQLRILITGK